MPLPVERTLIAPPRCRMGALTTEERAAVMARSPVGAKYKTAVNRESAFERLAQRHEGAAQADTHEAPSPARGKSAPAEAGRGAPGGLLWGTGRRQGLVETMAKQAARTAGSQISRRILRGVLGGILGGR